MGVAVRHTLFHRGGRHRPAQRSNIVSCGWLRRVFVPLVMLSLSSCLALSVVDKVGCLTCLMALSHLVGHMNMVSWRQPPNEPALCFCFLLFQSFYNYHFVYSDTIMRYMCALPNSPVSCHRLLFFSYRNVGSLSCWTFLVPAVHTTEDDSGTAEWHLSQSSFD